MDRALIAILALHPVRLEEALGLYWKDIDFHAGTICVSRAVTHPDRNKGMIREPKTEDSSRTIGLSAVASKVLRDMEKGEGLIFGGDTPYSYTKVRKACERAEKDMGFEEHITPSRFRSTVISDMYAQTGDAKLVQQAAGHADFDTTLKHYINSRKDTKAGAVATDTVYTQ